MRLLSRALLSTVFLINSVSLQAADASKPKAEAQEQAAENTVVRIETSKGDITVKLYDKRSPITVKNFLRYVDEDFYDDTIFHRVKPRFMIQGGGFDQHLVKKPTQEPIKNESRNRIRNHRGTLAMARTNDPDSATAQFFINVRMNRSLDYQAGKWGYAVFGEVLQGLHVVDDISIQETEVLMQHQNVPLEPILIHRIVRVE